MQFEKVLIIAGGTGGHIFPALVIADALKAQGVSVQWLGASVGMEEKLVGDQYPLHLLPIQAIRGKGLVKKVLAPLRLCRSVYLAMKLIKKINPDLVIGMGGYASGPGGVAAWLLRKPLVIHEQNAIAGLTNRVLSKVATKVFQAFPGAFLQKSQAITVGNPVRSQLFQLPKRAESEWFDGKSRPLRVLIIGGSQGARAINQAITGMLSLLTHKVPVVFWHQTGRHDFESVQTAYREYEDSVYRVAPFIDDMGAAYAWADVVICRAGALTVSELMAVGVAAVLVPFPYAVDDHQTANAKQLSDNKAAILLPQNELTSEKLYQLLLGFCQSPQELAMMGKRARALSQVDVVAKVLSHCREV